MLLSAHSSPGPTSASGFQDDRPAPQTTCRQETTTPAGMDAQGVRSAARTYDLDGDLSRRQDARRQEDGPAALARAITTVRGGGTARRVRGNGAATVTRASACFGKSGKTGPAIGPDGPFAKIAFAF